MLTSAARETLDRGADGHRRRGACRRGHENAVLTFALSLERLDSPIGTTGPAYRPFGHRPPARRGRPVPIRGRPAPHRQSARRQNLRLTVQVPVPDMANLENNTIWPDVENRIVDLIEAHTSRSCSPTPGAWPNAPPRGSTRSTPHATASTFPTRRPRSWPKSRSGRRSAAGESPTTVGVRSSARPSRTT